MAPNTQPMMCNGLRPLSLEVHMNDATGGIALHSETTNIELLLATLEHVPKQRLVLL